jgi:hypothetical protein
LARSATVTFDSNIFDQNQFIMKRTILSLGLVALFGFGLASCNKCVTCGSCPEGITLTDDAGNDATEVEFCESDADSKDEYDAAILLIEGFGCTCN